MRDLRRPDYRRSVLLANGQTGHQQLWECPSDPRIRDGVRAWAVLEVAWSEHLRTMVPTLRRLYTRETGSVRQVETLAVTAHGLARPAAGPGDIDAQAEVIDLVRELIAAMLEGKSDTAFYDYGIRKIFLAPDVLDPEVNV